MTLVSFYRLYQGFVRGSVRVTFDSIEAAHSLASFSSIPQGPVLLSQISGYKWLDIVPSSFAEVLLVSQRCRSLLSGFSGCTFVDTLVRTKQGTYIDNLSILVVTGRSGRIKPEEAQIVWKRAVPGGPLYEARYGLVFDDWDGSDIFRPQESSFILVTDKIRDEVLTRQLSNLVLKPVDEVELQTV